jgi:hypothetical protein
VVENDCKWVFIVGKVVGNGKRVVKMTVKQVFVIGKRVWWWKTAVKEICGWKGLLVVESDCKHVCRWKWVENSHWKGRSC